MITIRKQRLEPYRHNDDKISIIKKVEDYCDSLSGWNLFQLGTIFLFLFFVLLQFSTRKIINFSSQNYADLIGLWDGTNLSISWMNLMFLLMYLWVDIRTKYSFSFSQGGLLR